MKRPRLPRGLAAILVVVALGLAACQTTSSTPPPAATEGPTALIVGCVSIQAAECRFVAEQIVAAVPKARGVPFAVEISLFGCERRDVPCPPSLAVRPERAIVEYLDGEEPIEVVLSGPPQAPGIVVQEGSYSGLVQPTSQRAGGVGPFPFELGHCGLSHVVDFDGSFWIPVGQVDGEAPGLINSERGQMRFLAANLVQYQGSAGFAVTLVRFPGPKQFWLCD